MTRVKRRLALWNLAVLGLVIAIVVGAAIASELRAATSFLEQDLRRGAARAAARLEHVVDEAEEGHDDDDDAIPGEAGELLVVMRTGADGRTIANRRALPPGVPDEAAFHLALTGAETWSEHAGGGASVRLLTMPVLHGGRIIGAVQVGKSTAEARRSVGKTVVILSLTGAFGLVLAASAGVFLAGRAMRPISEALDRQRRFVADASHELRTPVAVLRARADLLARGAEAMPDRTREELVRLRKDADELSALLDELLDLARLDADQAALRLEPVAVGDAVEELVAQMAPLAGERGVSLVAEVEPVFARADLGRVRQVVRALVDNALAHTHDGGRVIVSVVRAGAVARIRVADDGVGIEEAHLPRLFDRFYRVETSRERRDGRGGAGLGLAIAAELARRMGGELAVTSTVGVGTTFELRLPLAGAR
jgi:signal transduction histidine kinase